jgi:hypothetical protein
LAVIPPIMGANQRNDWLDMMCAVKDANPNARPDADAWQSRSDRYDKGRDPQVWDTLEPRPGSYLSLFREAKRRDERWWAHYDGDVYDWMRDHAARFEVSQTPAIEPRVAQQVYSAPNRKYRRQKMSELRSTLPQWLIRNFLFQRQVGVIYGPPGSYKSFVVQALASMLAHGMEWEGRPLRKCRTVYVAAEGYAMFRARRLAWFRHHGTNPQDDGVEVINGPLDLTKPGDVIDFIMEMQEDIETVGLFIFDTLSCCTAGQNESDSAVMSQAIESAKLIADKLNVAVLLIHHPGKDPSRGSRGHSSLLGNIDMEGSVEREGDNV